MNAPDLSLFDFAVDMTRAHARETILSRPEPIFPKPELQDPDVRAAIAEEFFTEGRQPRRNIRVRIDP